MARAATFLALLPLVACAREASAPRSTASIATSVDSGAPAATTVVVPATCAPGVVHDPVGASAGVAIDGDTAFVLTNSVDFGPSDALGDVLAVPLAGGAPRVLARGQKNTRGIAVDARQVVWIADGGLVSVARAGGPTRVVVPSDHVARFAMAGANVLWISNAHTTREPSALRRATLAGAPATLATFDDAIDLALDATSAYVLTRTELSVVPLAGGSPRTIARGRNLSSVATLGADVFFADRDAGTISRVSGGTTRVVSSAQEEPRALVARDGRVWWLVGSAGWERSAVGVRTLDAGAVREIANGLGMSSFSLGVDSACVYYVAGNALVRAPR